MCVCHKMSSICACMYMYVYKCMLCVSLYLYVHMSEKSLDNLSSHPSFQGGDCNGADM